MSAGLSLPHDASPLQVTGEARYIDDLPMPANALHLAFGLSTVAHGEITGFDLSAVRAAPGVVMVLSAEDLPDMPDCSPSAHDEPLLAVGKVHYVGQPVFLVVAESHLAARKAAKLGKVSYRELPALLTVDDALAANSRFEQGPVIWAKGDAAGAIAKAPRVIEGSFEVGGQEHFYLEGQVAAAVPLEGGDFHVMSSTQHPTEVQHKVAHALHLPMSAVRVEVRRMGGGFGGKESQGNALAIACAVAARALGRPCRMRYDRDDDMMITGKRHDLRIGYRAGIDDQGRIQGIEFQHLFRCGWSQDLSLPVADRAMLHADNCYHLPDIRIESHRLKTNTQSATAYRGFGGPQGIIGIERVIDHVAFEVGMDPSEVRKLNFYREMESAGASGGDISASMKAQTTPYHMPVEDFIGHGLVAELEKTSGYAARRAEIAAWNAGSPILKRGIALVPVKFGISFTLTWLNQAGALVHVYQDGSIALNHGGTEMGQGLQTKMQQLAADTLGVALSAVRVMPARTDLIPNTSATAASSGTDLNGAAVCDACGQLRTRLLGVAASFFNCDAHDITIADGVATGPDGRTSGFSELCEQAYRRRVPLFADGFYRTPGLAFDRQSGRGTPFHYFTYGAAVSEVEVDGFTGEHRLLRVDLLQDVGESLSPLVDRGQVEGGFIQGLGWLTLEELVWDDTGRLRTDGAATYKIPSWTEVPPEFNVGFLPRAAQADVVMGSKAVGEPPLLLAISVREALRDAVAAFGPGEVASFDSPLTPERLFFAVRDASQR